MLAYQGGAKIKADKLTVGLNLAYYDYIRYDINYKYPNGNTVTGSGTSSAYLNAGDFDILNFLAQVKYGWRYPNFSWTTPRTLTPRARTATRTPPGAWAAARKNKAQKDWSTTYRYAHIEPNAVVGAFTDSDFKFGNRKGSELEVQVQHLQPADSRRGLAGPLTRCWSRSGSSTRPQVDLEYAF